MMGHCSNAAMIRMLKASVAKKEVIEAAKHFRCPCCEELKKDDEPRVARPTRPEAQLKFNQEVSVDVLEIHDAQDGRHSILSMVDIATHYHVAIRVGPGGTPSSKVCAEAMNLSWFTPFGAPRVMVSDKRQVELFATGTWRRSQGKWVPEHHFNLALVSAMEES